MKRWHRRGGPSQRLRQLGQQHKAALEELLATARALHGPQVELRLEESNGDVVLGLDYAASRQRRSDLPAGVEMIVELVMVVLVRGPLRDSIPALRERLGQLPAVHVLPLVQTHPN